MHKIYEFYSDVQSVYTNVSSTVWATVVNCDANMPDLTDANGYIGMEFKFSDWSKAITVSLALYDIQNSQFLYYNITSDGLAGVPFYPNEDEWTCLRVPLDYFLDSVYGGINPSSATKVSIGIYTSSGDTDITIQAKNYFFEYGNDLKDHISFSLVNSGGGNAVAFDPEYDYKGDLKKIETEHRLFQGGQYKYKFGEYEQIKFGQDYFPTSACMAVNSAWTNNTPCKFVHTNSFFGKMYDVKVSGNKPFTQYQVPYVDLMTGKVELESF